MSQAYRPQRGKHMRQQETVPTISEEERNQIKTIIEKGDPETLVALAERAGQELKRLEATRSQVRNVFGTVRQIQMRWQRPDSPGALASYRDVVLLRPKLAYYANKEKKEKARGMQYLQSVLTPALELIRGDEAERYQRFNRFVDFFEAIVAYHQAAGAKD